MILYWSEIVKGKYLFKHHSQESKLRQRYWLGLLYTEKIYALNNTINLKTKGCFINEDSRHCHYNTDGVLKMISKMRRVVHF